MWILFPNIDLRCFVMRQILSQTYTLFGGLFTGQRHAERWCSVCLFHISSYMFDIFSLLSAQLDIDFRWKWSLKNLSQLFDILDIFDVFVHPALASRPEQTSPPPGTNHTISQLSVEMIFPQYLGFLTRSQQSRFWESPPFSSNKMFKEWKLFLRAELFCSCSSKSAPA